MTVFSKTWCQPENARCLTRDGNIDRSVYSLLRWKDSLVNAPVGAWTVIASSNRSAASTSDLWLSGSDVARGSTLAWPGSWIWLKSPTGSRGPFYLLMDWTSTADYRCNFYISKQAPDLSNLTPFRVPSPKSPYVNQADAIFADYYSGNYLDWTTTLVADDGSFFFFSCLEVFISGGFPYADVEWMVAFNIMDDVDFRDPFGACFVVYFSKLNTWLSTGQSTKYFYSLDPDGTQINLSLTSRNGPLGTDNHNFSSRVMSDDKLRGKLYSEPVWMFCPDSGRKGFRGRLSDIWWTTRPPMYEFGTGAYEGRDLKLQKVGCFWVPAAEPVRI